MHFFEQSGPFGQTEVSKRSGCARMCCMHPPRRKPHRFTRDVTTSTRPLLSSDLRNVHFGTKDKLYTYRRRSRGQSSKNDGRRMPRCPCLRPEDPEVRVLDYRHCSLEHVPADVFNWERTLEELYVDANQIRDLPRELFFCHGLRKLCVSDNEITSIPPAITSLGHLEHLDISKNGVVDLPDSIKGCKYLSTVEASVNPLGKLPEGFTQLLNLSELYLNDTFLDYLPGSFGRLSQLRILEVRENHLKTLPMSLSRLTALERLDIGNNEFTELPEVVGSLVSLLELWCDSNQIARLPETLGRLKQLMFFDASKNRIECLPNEIDGCVALADLHLSTNLLQQLPENIGRLSNMTTLKVDDNRMTSLPFSIGGLVSLSELNISANDLEELPPSIGFLRHLRTLYADENFLYEIPPELGSCSGLTVVSFRSNNLVYIPDELGRIPRLRVLNLSDNKIRCLPYSLTRLKELQALWLSENQTKPLIRLQPDIDIDTGQDDNDDMYSEHGSFHPSLWEEERKTRQRIHFDFDEPEEPGKLERCPTPYPKEMKHRIQHMRNLALKQLNIPNGAVRQGPDPGGGAAAEAQRGKHGGESIKEPSPSGRDSKDGKPVSPLMAERHHLLKADKEKNARDKEKMSQHRRSKESVDKRDEEANATPTLDSSSSRPLRDGDYSAYSQGSQNHLQVAGSQGRPGLSPQSNPSHHHSNPAMDTSLHQSQVGSTPSLVQAKGSSVRLSDFDPSLALSGPAVLPLGYHQGSGPSRPSSVHSEQLRVRSHPSQQHQFYQAPHGSHRRSRGYESDTGYRSDAQSEMGYRSDTGFRLHHSSHKNDGYSSDFEVMRRGGRGYRGHREGGYASDMEGYGGRRVYPNVYRPLSGHAPRHPGGGHHNNQHGLPPSGSSKTQGYSNAPFFRRTKIQNDELYEQQCAAPMPSHPPMNPPSKSNSMRTLQEDVGPDSRGQGTKAGGAPENNEDELWKAQLYKASVKLQKTPSDKRKKIQPGASLQNLTNMENLTVARSRAPVVEQTHNDSNDSVFIAPPPYQPAPPYSASKPKDGSLGRQAEVLRVEVSSSPNILRTSSALDIPVMASSPKFGRSRVQESPRPVGTPRRHEMENLQRPSGYGSKTDVRGSPLCRPNHLPLGMDSNGPPAPRSVPDGRPQSLPNQSPHTPRANHSHINNIRTPDRRSDPAHSTDFRTPPDKGHARQGHTPIDTPLQLTQYEKDVAVFKQMEPPSQVSSSTDSGYGQHIYDRMAGHDGMQPSPSPHGQSPRSTHIGTPQGPPIRASPSRDSAVYSRESTPGYMSDPATPGSVSENHRRSVGPPDGHNDSAEYRDASPRKIDVFRVTIAKNPGLGFSIAGGIGSPGNPFVPGDQGIFITKVQDQGPASTHLRRGDKILEVNGIDFTSIDHREAVNVLRTSGHDVTLVIERSDLPSS